MPKKSAKKTKTVKPSFSRKSVDIRKATNGFVVSSFTDKGETLQIAKTAKEANDIVHNMLK